MLIWVRSTLHPLLHRLALACAVAGCAAAFLVAVLTAASIVGRAAWSRPIPGDVELSQFGIALCIALCLPWCQQRRGNIIVDFFTRNAGPRARHGMDAAGKLLLSAMLGLLAWRAAAGALAVRESQETTMILGLPMWVNYASLAPGLALTALVALVQAVADPMKADAPGATNAGGPAAAPPPKPEGGT